MSKDKQEVYVWECIFYTEGEDGGITYYEAPNHDWSTIAESVEVEDLLEIKTSKLLQQVEYLVEQVEEDVPQNDCTRHLWDAVEGVKDAMKATRHEPVFITPM
jgi:hypothetical protein